MVLANPPERGLLVLGEHVAAGLGHGDNGVVQRDEMRAFAHERQARTVDRLDRADCVAFDAGDLHQSAHWITG